MREIKFRVWSRSQGYMDLPTSISIDDSGHVDHVYCYGDDYADGDFELMQFTGLRDKNGREIYEGDLFEHKFGYSVLDDTPHSEMGVEYGVVVFADGRFGVRTPGWGVRSLRDLLSRKGHLDDMPDSDLFKMIIAGNIFENPELLEAEIK
ncbi:YopX family protein [Lacticaseibacillus manihotivorans]|nr:YopX family protein [Lacticaseibacillus manihotivorans]